MDTHSTEAKPTGEGIPAVVAVVVAKDPGEFFEDMLHSLGSQDYPNISVLVIDADSASPVAERVARVLPSDAYIHRISGNPGWSVAANQSMELISESPFLLFCHDDVMLERSCVSTMMAELYRSNAAIVGPKLVSWDDPRRLLQIGMSCDRFGVPVEQVDKGEFDQEQYDNPRDMFYIPGGVQLIRSDLMAALGGFDEEITFIGEDLDLCWRAQAVGAKVRVVPKAKAKHLESADHKISPGFRRKLATRHRLRTLMGNITGRSRFTAIPMAISIILLEALYALFNGRRKHAKEAISAIGWNLARSKSNRKRRQRLTEIRRLTDKQIRKKQVPGSAQLSNFWRNKFEAGQSRLDSVLSNQAAQDPTSSFHSMIIFFSTMALLLLSIRGLFFGGFQPLGHIPVVENSRELMSEWFRGWRSSGTGGYANAPLTYPLFAVLRGLFFWSEGWFNALVLTVPIFAGYWGSSRLARPFGSARMATIAGAMYLFNPIVYWMMRSGQWESLVVWAGAPFLVASLFKVANIAPFAGRSESDKSYYAVRTFPVRVLRYGVLVTLLAMFAPSVVVVAVILPVALALSSIINLEAFRGYIFSSLAAVVVPTVLLMPWSFDVIGDFSWNWLVGPQSSESSGLSVAEIILFQSAEVYQEAGDEASFDISKQVLTIVGAVLPVFAAVSLIVARVKSAPIVLSGMFLTVTVWVLMWLSVVDLLPVRLPAGESMLSLAALGMILTVLAVAVEYEQTYLRSVSRMRHVVAAVGSLGVLILFAGGLVMALTGRFDIPESPRRSTAASLYGEARLLDKDSDEAFTDGRIVWIGHSGVVPLDVYETDLGVPFAVSGPDIDIKNRWVPGPVGKTQGIGEAIDLAKRGGTSNLGRLLAAYGVDYVIVAEEIARGYKPNPLEPTTLGALNKQLDLRQDKSGNSNFTIYKNTASGGIAAGLSSFSDSQAKVLAEQVFVDLSDTRVKAVDSATRSGRWDLPSVPDESAVYVATQFDSVSVSGPRKLIHEGFAGMTIIDSGPAGVVRLEYPISFYRPLMLLIQFLLITSSIVIAQTVKGAER